MNDQLFPIPQDALEQIPGTEWRRARIRKLEGGLSNDSYSVTVDERHYVLRIDNKLTHDFGVDRRREFRAWQHAARAGLAPGLVYADPEGGILLREFSQGRAWQAGDLAVRRNLERLAALLRRVHELPALDAEQSIAASARHYLVSIDKDDEFGNAARVIVRFLDSTPAPESPVLCHHDLVAANIIDSGDLQLIDWEYAADNDALFDLASLIGFHDLDEEQGRVLLTAYAGRSSAEDRENLARQCLIYDALQFLWTAVRFSRWGGAEDRNRLRHILEKLSPFVADV